MKHCVLCKFSFDVEIPAELVLPAILKPGEWVGYCAEHAVLKVQDGLAEHSDFLPVCYYCGTVDPEPWEIDLDDPPAWALGCDPERCEFCGTLLV